MSFSSAKGALSGTKDASLGRQRGSLTRQSRTKQASISAERAALASQKAPNSVALRRVNEFLAALQAQRNASEHTISAYRKDLLKFMRYASKGLDSLRVALLTTRALIA